MAETSRRRAMSKAFDFGVCPLSSVAENADWLLDYCSRRLDPELTALFERHMAQCAACQSFVGSQSALWRALDAYEACQVSEDFDRNLLERLGRSPRPSLFSHLWDRLTAFGTAPWRPLIPVAAALVFAVGLWMRPDSSALAPAATASKAELFDVEQMERTLEDMEMLRQLGVEDGSNPQQM